MATVARWTQRALSLALALVIGCATSPERTTVATPKEQPPVKTESMEVLPTTAIGRSISPPAELPPVTLSLKDLLHIARTRHPDLAAAYARVIEAQGQV